MNQRLPILLIALTLFATCDVSSDEIEIASSPDGEVRVMRIDRTEFGCHSTGHGIAMEPGFRDTSRIVVESFGTRYPAGTARYCECEAPGGEVLSYTDETVVVQCGDTPRHAVFYLNESSTLNMLCWVGDAPVPDPRMSVHAVDILRTHNGDGLQRIFDEVRAREGTAGVARALGETCRHVSSTWEATLETVPEAERTPIVEALRAELAKERPSERAVKRAAALGITSD